MTTRLKKRLIESKRFATFVINHFIKDDCTYRASALAFTSLLAIVPLMSVGFAILSTFPVFNDLRGPIQDFIFENFVPTTGQVIQDYLQLFATQVSKLSIIGIIFLFITALLLMLTIERAMNKIWHVESSRQGVSAFLLYWAILSLTPFLLGLSIAASSYFFSMPILLGYHAHSILFRLSPSLLSLIGFTFLYVIVPNCKVRFIHGFLGALLATLLFESAKKGFAYYLSQYNTYDLLYGAFATIPIFFIWVYWLWLITLMGAEMSYALSVHYQRRQGTSIDGFSQALLWMHCFWEAQQKGHEVTLDDLINASKQPFSEDISDVLLELSNNHLIKTTSNGNHLLSRDLKSITLYEFKQLLPYRFPDEKKLLATGSPIAQKWHPQIKEAEVTLEKNLNINLDALFRKD